MISEKGNTNTSNKLSVIQGHKKSFQNIDIHLCSLGTAAYRIEWHSKMSGTTTNISRLDADKYVVVKKWPSNKKLPVVSTDFESRKGALVHFINNVDILKAATETVYEAKKYCLELFTELERIDPIKRPNFQKVRLQGAIGRIVEIKNYSGKKVIAEGTLLQLMGNSAEVRVEKKFNLSKSQPIQRFKVQRVFIK